MRRMKELEGGFLFGEKRNFCRERNADMISMGFDHTCEAFFEDERTSLEGAKVEAAFADESNESFAAGDFEDVHWKQVKHQKRKKREW